MNKFNSIFGQILQLFSKVEFYKAFNLFSLDATIIELCATLFDWAKFRQTKGAVKLHLLLEPVFAHITEGKVHEINIARIELEGYYSKLSYPYQLRRVEVWDDRNKEVIVLLTP